ncbi:hypothetical protein [Endozoicomonas euniceicola]|uniref:Uncharacterized protein n=1 Tax=Endozoicomonas euniceicola TaxID=1234143 RepID=A0ABY6GV99_9GAMM|nr:hypothetical protein [Endozoicomonas euniceicola]UYM16698.1 hypothetical protein NX720_01830 [Endozoicomonas euniceicola]
MQCYVNHRFERDKNDYGSIFIDPPTFLNSRKFEGVFDVRRDHGHLTRLAMRRLNEGGTLYFSNNFRRSYWRRLRGTEG